MKHNFLGLDLSWSEFLPMETLHSSLRTPFVFLYARLFQTSFLCHTLYHPIEGVFLVSLYSQSHSFPGHSLYWFASVLLQYSTKQKQLGKGKSFIWLKSPKKVTSRDARAGTPREELKSRPWRKAAHWLVPHGPLSLFCFIQPRTTVPGVALPLSIRVGAPLINYQSRKCPSKTCPQANLM